MPKLFVETAPESAERAAERINPVGEPGDASARGAIDSGGSQDREISTTTRGIQAGE